MVSSNTTVCAINDFVDKETNNGFGSNSRRDIRLLSARSCTSTAASEYTDDGTEKDIDDCINEEVAGSRSAEQISLKETPSTADDSEV